MSVERDQRSSRPDGLEPQPAHPVDATHPTSRYHHILPSGAITAEYRVFIDVPDASHLERAGHLVLEHLRDWRTFYRRSHVEFVEPAPESEPSWQVIFKFAPLALWGTRFTGRELTVVTVAFQSPARLPDGKGWFIDGELIDGYDQAGRRLPHDFTGRVRTEVRIIDEPAEDHRVARLGIEVRDIWIEVTNHKPIPNSLAVFVHLLRCADGFGGLREVVRKELKLH